MEHTVLDLTNLAYQPTTKSCEQPGNPKRHVTFAMSERRPAYPARAPDMDEDEDEDDKPLVRPASREESAKEKRDLDTEDEDLLPLVQTKDSRERAEDTSILGRKAESEAPRNIMRKLSEKRNLRDLHLKHYHTSTAPVKKRTTHLDIPRKFYDLYQHVVTTCHFCNSLKPRPERSRCERTSSRRIWRHHLFRSWVGKDWRQNLRISDYFGSSHITFDSLFMLKSLYIGSNC